MTNDLFYQLLSKITDRPYTGSSVKTSLYWGRSYKISLWRHSTVCVLACNIVHIIIAHFMWTNLQNGVDKITNNYFTEIFKEITYPRVPLTNLSLSIVTYIQWTCIDIYKCRAPYNKQKCKQKDLISSNVSVSLFKLISTRTCSVKGVWAMIRRSRWIRWSLDRSSNGPGGSQVRGKQ